MTSTGRGGTDDEPWIASDVLPEDRRAIAVLAGNAHAALQRLEREMRSEGFDQAQVQRAAELVYVLEARDAALAHRRYLLGWLLGRFASWLRREPLDPGEEWAA